ncbi:hypothetical protein ALQ26_03772 [Pseudomonas amygdali pv. lachrymans]|nr:hypothetical protein ALQ26_03772 [Pseudomonas amygdali pv. lachrymans]
MRRQICGQGAGFGQRHLGLRVCFLKGLQRRERLSADQQQTLGGVTVEQGRQRLLRRAG